MSDPTKADIAHAWELWRWCLSQTTASYQTLESNVEWIEVREVILGQFTRMIHRMREADAAVDELECSLAQEEEAVDRFSHIIGGELRR